MTAKKSIKRVERDQLLHAAQTGCYNPNCSEPLFTTRGGLTISNFEVAHIRDELPPSEADADVGWRYWPDDLGQAERNHFSNLVLLCAPCHKLVDRILPRDFDADLLLTWKVSAEGGTAHELAQSLGVIDEQSLAELLEDALSASVGERRVVVIIEACLLENSRQGLSMPFDVVGDLVELNHYLSDHEVLFGIDVRNHGVLPVEVAGFNVELHRDDYDTNPAWLQPSTHPHLNPGLPKRIESGSSARWVFSPHYALDLLSADPEFFTHVRASVLLATGEAFRSELVDAKHLRA